MTSANRATTRRPPLAGAAIVACAVMLGACGGGAPATTTTASPVTTATTAAAGPTTTVPSSPEARVVAALDAVGARYSFTATVSVDGAVTTTVEGRATNGTGEYRVTSAGTVVDYIIGPQGQWARHSGGDWAVLGGAAPVADPLAPLAHPTSVSIVSDDGATVILDAVYPASDLGFPDAGEVLVTLTVHSGILAETRYIAAVGNRPATVVTTFDVSGDIVDVTIPGA